MSEEQQQMTVTQQLALEGYRNLSSWNDRDNQTVASFDKIFLPGTAGAWALTFANKPGSFIYVYIVSWLLLTFWVLLSCRYRERIADRFGIMKKIECCLGFKAHLLLRDDLNIPKDVTLRKIFYGVTIILGAAAAVMTPCKLEVIVDCLCLKRVLVLIPFVLTTIIIILVYLIKAAKKE